MRTVYRRLRVNSWAGVRTVAEPLPSTQNPAAEAPRSVLNSPALRCMVTYQPYTA